MKIFKNIDQYSEGKKSILSIGVFDGIHLGHREILLKIKKLSQEKNAIASVLTFHPHPRWVFNPDEKIQLLHTEEEKIKILENLGIEHLFILPFDENLKQLSGQEFIEKILVQKLNIQHIIIGYDHTFGKNKSGNFELLEKFSKKWNYSVEQIQPCFLGNETISSTKIRNLLLEGNILKANQMLSAPYCLSGKVIHGKKIGRTIGFPTANIEIPEHKLIPKKGAYIVEVQIKNSLYKGMLSIGTNPTVNGKNLSIEVYILDFNQEIYGEKIDIFFRDFLHEEIKFSTIEELIQKLNEDREKTILFFQ